MDTLPVAAPFGVPGRQEESVRLKYDLIELVFQALRDIPSAMLIVSEDGIVRMENREARRLLLPYCAELAGKRLFPAGAPANWLKGGSLEIADVIISIPAGSGQHIDFTAKISPWMRDTTHGAEGLYALALGQAVNSKELKKNSDGQLLSALQQVLPSVVHELRNPLAAVAVAAELLSEDALAGSVQNGMKDILFEVQRMKFSLNRIVNLKRAPRAWRTIPAAAAFREFIQFFKLLCNEKNLQFTVQIDPTIEMSYDAQAMVALLHHILLNATQACSAGGSVELRVGLEPPNEDGAQPSVQMLVIEVTDTGCGMEEKTLVRCREPFFSTRRNGAGLGLYACNEMVNEAGGTLHITSSPGRGTRVCVRLPNAPPAAGGVSKLALTVK